LRRNRPQVIKIRTPNGTADAHQHSPIGRRPTLPNRPDIAAPRRLDLSQPHDFATDALAGANQTR
jgi:hypothetical protein